MTSGSIVRGAIAAASVGIAFALPRSAIDESARIALLAVLHLALPVAAVWWSRRPDVQSLDVGLAGIGVTYIGVLALTRDGPGALYVGLPAGYAAYCIVASGIFSALANVRRAMRLRAIKRRRARRSLARAA
ncbi:MAG TPA: hypothetical protein VIL20_22245 [Sandaracinaceae bacterium]